MRSAAATHCASGATSAMRTWFDPGFLPFTSRPR